jgi:GNAT superfamily N-acetyltransferase
LWAAALGGPPPPTSSAGVANPFEVRELDSAWANLAMGTEAGLVPGRLARGSRCFGAWIGHELVGYGWLSTKSEWIGELELEIAPAAGEAYIWNCVTLAPHRRKGVFRSVLASVVATSREEGLARLWIASGGDLGARALEVAGFARAMRFDIGSRFGMRWLRVAAVEGGDPGLFTSAREVMAIKPGFSMHRSKSRKH